MKNVLFICVHNSGRSQIAEAFFNLYSENKARAISAGSNPSSVLNPKVVQAMAEIGIDISKNKPKLLTPEMMDNVDLAVTMGCEESCPVTTIPTEDWGLKDPKDKSIEEVRKIRDEIKNRIIKLLKEINA